MREILHNHLWIGNARDIRPLQVDHSINIAAVIDFAIDEAIATLPCEIVYCRIPIIDGANHSKSVIRLAFDTVASLLGLEIALLVCCSAGLSRSPAIAAAGISKNQVVALDEV